LAGGSKKPDRDLRTDEERFEKTIRRKQARRMRARREKRSVFWYGLGMFGTIGWSVAIPTLIGVALGVWIDLRWPGRVSWTLTLLLLGLVVGCLNAWYWVKREREAMEKKDMGEGDE
jgi:ATP synthase protein I